MAETRTKIDRRVERCVNAAIKAGCPPDQIRGLMNVGYIPYPWQWQFHAAAREADHEGGPVDIGLGGARGPGKSHGVISQVALDDCVRVEGLKCLFLRQTGSSAQESFDDLINKAVRGRTNYRKTKNSLRLDNGSRIILGGFKDENDIDKYIGVEYDIIVVEELTQLTKEKYEKLRGSLRTSKPNWRPRMYTSFNPGGVGHVWVRERYVLPFRSGKQTQTRFIPSTYRENPALNREYIDYLESLGGSLGKAWRDGEWDVFAGQYFDEWNYDLHVVKPFEIPFTWPRFRSIDPSGRSGATSAHWYTVNNDGVLYVIREHYGTGKDMDEHAKAIAKKSQDDDGVQERYQYTVIDSAAFAKAGYSETGAEIYERNGVTGLVPAAKERVIGWNVVHQYLRHGKDEDGHYQQPKIRIFDTCVKLIETIPLAQHDDHHPEDVSNKGGVGDGDHWDCLDDLRYMVRTLREAKAPKAETLVERRIRSLRERTNAPRLNYTRNEED